MQVILLSQTVHLQHMNISWKVSVRPNTSTAEQGVVIDSNNTNFFNLQSYKMKIENAQYEVQGVLQGTLVK